MRRGLILSVIGLGLLAILYFVRPLFHPLYMEFYANPQFLAALLFVGIGGTVAAMTTSPWVRIGVALIVVPYVGWALHIGANVYPKIHIADTTDVSDVEVLPRTRPENTRFLPMNVAKNYVSSSLREPRYRAGDADVTFLDGKPYWSFPLLPEGWYNEVFRTVKGAHYVDMTRSGRHIEKRTLTKQKPNYELQVGPGLKYLDNYSWVLPKHEYNVTYKEPFVVPHNDRLYLAVPFIEYDYELTYGVPHSVPRWGGVALIRNDGQVTVMGRDEALGSEVLQGQRLVPFSIARYYAGAFKYRHGYFNTIWGHEDEIELAPVPGKNNDQPFLISTTEGPAYIVAAEPYGTAYGLSEIYVMDARSGELRRFSAGAEQTLDGPARATDRVWSDLPRVNRDGYEMAEPLPAMRNGQLYWNIRLMPKEGSGISYIAFVDAQTREVHAFQGVEKAREFLAGDTDEGEVKDESESTDKQADTTTAAPEATTGARRGGPVTIEVRDESGSIQDRLQVEPGQSMTITVPEATPDGGETAPANSTADDDGAGENGAKNAQGADKEGKTP